MDDVYARYREALSVAHHEAAEGRFAEALRHYQTATSLAGERVLPHVGVGGMLMRLGRPKDALAAYDHALTLEPNNLDALSGRAAALLASGRRDEAARVQQQIVSARYAPVAAGPTAPAGEATPVSAADTLHVAGQQALAAGNAEAAIDAWLAESGEHAAAERFDAALDASLRALAVSPGAPRIHLEMARLYFRRGWTDKGVERALLLSRLMDLEPDAQIEADLRALAAEHAASDERLTAVANRSG